MSDQLTCKMHLELDHFLTSYNSFPSLPLGGTLQQPPNCPLLPLLQPTVSIEQPEWTFPPLGHITPVFCPKYFMAHHLIQSTRLRYSPFAIWPHFWPPSPQPSARATSILIVPLTAWLIATQNLYNLCSVCLKTFFSQPSMKGWSLIQPLFKCHVT